ncbi:GRAM domain-containing protein 4 [Galemys pyrenaicus]|uniref:GRAM domain-containing protein 4 n=1 Tax=Galemys pyrenaicus TaxID=202257 RepID=A0A8J6DQB8_GALPY|nr:GRAM domain-containing protein 4 [Galemys pyrenaicus]
MARRVWPRSWFRPPREPEGLREGRAGAGGAGWEPADSGVPRGAGRGRPALIPPLPRDADRHVKVKQRGSVLNMLRRLDKIRFRGHKRDDFLDLAESPTASDTECGDELPLKTPRASLRDGEELRDPVSAAAGPGPGRSLWARGGRRVAGQRLAGLRARPGRSCARLGPSGPSHASAESPRGPARPRAVVRTQGEGCRGWVGVAPGRLCAMAAGALLASGAERPAGRLSGPLHRCWPREPKPCPGPPGAVWMPSRTPEPAPVTSAPVLSSRRGAARTPSEPAPAARPLGAVCKARASAALAGPGRVGPLGGSWCRAGPGSLVMAAGIQDFTRTESDRLNEIKGHLEIALLEKHFLREWAGRRGLASLGSLGQLRLGGCLGRAPQPALSGHPGVRGASGRRVPAPGARCRSGRGSSGLKSRGSRCSVCWGGAAAACRAGPRVVAAGSPSCCPARVGDPPAPGWAGAACGRPAAVPTLTWPVEEELRKLREEANAEVLRQELERERQRRAELEQKVQEVLRARTEEQAAQQPPKGPAPSSNGAERWGQGLCSRFQKFFYERFGEYVEDFRFQPEESTVETEEPLSARRLTENMRRLKRGAEPVTSFVKNLSALSDWYSVYTSAIAFTVYMNAVWHGWAIPMFLFLAILRLSLNYLIARGWRIQWSIVPEVSEAVVSPAAGPLWPVERSPAAARPCAPAACPFLYPTPAGEGPAAGAHTRFPGPGPAGRWRRLARLRPVRSVVMPRTTRLGWKLPLRPQEPPKEDLTVSEKFQLVLDVAQKAQNLFGKMADILEKIKNLFMWVQPEITQKLYVALWAAFLTSCFFPYRLVGLAVGLYAGVKFFLIDFIFKRCPRLRAKYDTPYIIWKNLPTDPQLKERPSATVPRRLQTAATRSYVSSAPTGLSKDEDAGRFHGAKKGNFHEIFNLTENERPLAVCEHGWRCCLINRDRKMPTDYIRNGVLYVTENYLCFESSKSGSSKRNKVIRLLDITDIQKYKVLSVLPGSGMGIAVSTPSTQKPLVFGAMVHRDEAFETIFSQYMKITAAASGSDS